ncbi:hypothetical protein IHE31_02750 (plasmid) [Mycetohabitans rhizoxinica]|uniref:hypothetical protein n=1 Tax=Mycetohabitans rhizoxinica TaxID=412963 RepID=UPI0030CA9CD5
MTRVGIPVDACSKPRAGELDATNGWLGAWTPTRRRRGGATPFAGERARLSRFAWLSRDKLSITTDGWWL